MSERTKIIQPLEVSVVRNVLVKDGDKVKAGQVLVELDPTMANADQANVQEQFEAALSEEQRTAILLQLLSKGELITQYKRGLEVDLPYNLVKNGTCGCRWLLSIADHSTVTGRRA